VKDSMTAGLTLTKRFEIDRERTIDFMGDELRVYATPNLVRDMEHTCRDLIMEHTEGDEDSVGAHMAVDHMGATLLGMRVDITAKVTDVAGPRITFELEAHDNLEQVGKSKHIRFVINKGKQGERLKKKAEKAKAAG